MSSLGWGIAWTTLAVATLAAARRQDSASHPAPFGPLAEARPADGVARFAMELRPAPDSAWRPVGTMTVAQSSARGTVRRVIVYDYGGGRTVVDTTLSVAASLAPIVERTHKSSGAIITLDFAGRVVTGEMGAPGTRRAIHDTLASPAFNTTDLELVVRALPLAAGYHASLPVYDPEFGGWRRAEVRVAGTCDVDSRASRRPRRAWVVVARDRRLESTYRVDVRTRALLGIDVRVHDTGAAYRIRPAP